MSHSAGETVGSNCNDDKVSILLLLFGVDVPPGQLSAARSLMTSFLVFFLYRSEAT